MPRSNALHAVLSVACLAASAALAAEGDQPQEQPPSAQTPAKPEKRTITNLAVTVPLQAYCKEQNLPAKVIGEGAVRIVLVGNVNFPQADKVVQAGNETLKALDIWTGTQGVFISPSFAEKELYYIVLFATDQEYLGFVDFMRRNKILPPPEGQDDLPKRLLNFMGPLSMVAVAKNVETTPVNFGIHVLTCSALSGFFMARGDVNVPPWVHEGLSSELQRLLCDGKVLWCSISYEMSSPEMQGNWARDVASLIRRNDKSLRTATQVMGFSLISLSGDHYKLMWSFCAMLVRSSGNTKGPDNKFLKLLDELASGTQPPDAVKKVYGVAEPRLTQSWFSWAQQQQQ